MLCIGAGVYSPLIFLTGLCPVIPSEAAFDTSSALCYIAKVMQNVNTDPSLFLLGCVFPQLVVMWFGRSGGDLMYIIFGVLKSAGADSGYASDVI